MDTYIILRVRIGLIIQILKTCPSQLCFVKNVITTCSGFEKIEN